MGRVYRARDIRLDREVALKVLPAEVATDHELLARFRREAKILAALSHPNIATLFGLEELDGTCVLALELVGGETLAEYLKGRRLGLNRALEMCLQIAGALEAAHDRGIIHRDVKPSNVMVSSTGDVKLLDFGIARAMQTGTTPPEDAGQPTETRLTQKGTLIGTPAYMSPEQIRGQPLGAGTDVWSFGCLMYEMLAGRRAFGYATVADTFAAILEREPDWKRLPDRTPPPLRSFLTQCLAKERRRRPRDIRRGLLEVETSLGMLGRDRMRWRLPASIAGILAILALAVGATQIWRWQSRAEPQPLAEAPESVADLASTAQLVPAQRMAPAARRGVLKNPGARGSQSVDTVIAGSRIAFVVPVLGMAGAERQALLLARYLLDRHDARPEFWGLARGEGLAGECERGGVPWRVQPVKWIVGRSPWYRPVKWIAGGSRPYRQAARFWRALHRERFDLLMPYAMPGNVLCGALAGFLANGRCIWGQRDTGVGHSVGFSRGQQRFAARRVRHFIANSQGGARFVEQDLSVPASCIEVIANGIALAPAREGREQWRQRLAVGDRFVACMAARLNRKKDHVSLLHGWRRVVSASPGAPPLLVIAGVDQGVRRSLEALRDSLDLRHDVRFAGHVEDITGLLSSVDLYAHCARTEGCPNAVLEAMLSGLACVVANNEGVREVLGDRAEMDLVPLDDLDAFANRIVELVQRPDERIRIGAADRDRASAEYGVEKMCARSTAVVARVLQGS